MIQKFTVIGISDSRKQFFSPEIQQRIAAGRVFSGGKRHYEIVQELLPPQAVWIEITVPLQPVLEEYRKYPEITVFASGDPLFFGFGNTLKREFPDARTEIFPSFNSLQMLAHHFLLPYSAMRNVSLTGREWDEFDQALINGESMIGVLTDRRKTPAIIASRMLDYGYDNYDLYLGEQIGNESQARFRKMTIQAAATLNDLTFPNALILKQTRKRFRPFGIPDNCFSLLDGRAAMITKMPVRLTTLSLLELHNRRSFWDIGFCTGSVSIEAKLQFPHLEVTSFEVRPQGKALMEDNSRKMGTPGIRIYIGDFLEAPLEQFAAPDAVFIGGHNGHLCEIVQRVHQVLKPGGIIVFNSVSEDSKALFEKAVSIAGMTIDKEIRLTADHHNPILIMQAQ